VLKIYENFMEKQKKKIFEKNELLFVKNEKFIEMLIWMSFYVYIIEWKKMMYHWTITTYIKHENNDFLSIIKKFIEHNKKNIDNNHMTKIDIWNNYIFYKKIWLYNDKNNEYEKYKTECMNNYDVEINIDKILNTKILNVKKIKKPSFDNCYKVLVNIIIYYKLTNNEIKNNNINNKTINDTFTE
jgi:hypothetical protein